MEAEQLDGQSFVRRTTSGLAQEEEEQGVEEKTASEQESRQQLTEATVKTGAERSENSSEACICQNCTEAKVRFSRSATRLFPRARGAWRSEDDLPLVAERQRSPYGPGLSMNVRGGNGNEGMEGGDCGDEEGKAGYY